MYFQKSKGTCKQTSKHKEFYVKVCKNSRCEYLKIELQGFRVPVTKKQDKANFFLKGKKKTTNMVETIMIISNFNLNCQLEKNDCKSLSKTRENKF